MEQNQLNSEITTKFEEVALIDPAAQAIKNQLENGMDATQLLRSAVVHYVRIIAYLQKELEETTLKYETLHNEKIDNLALRKELEDAIRLLESLRKSIHLYESFTVLSEVDALLARHQKS